MLSIGIAIGKICYFCTNICKILVRFDLNSETAKHSRDKTLQYIIYVQIVFHVSKTMMFVYVKLPRCKFSSQFEGKSCNVMVDAGLFLDDNSPVESSSP